MDEAGRHFYTSVAAPKGYRIQVLLLSLGRGFNWDIYDQKDNLIRRSHTHEETPGAARRSALDWINKHIEDL